jgi:hypothetical protein
MFRMLDLEALASMPSSHSINAVCRYPSYPLSRTCIFVDLIPLVCYLLIYLVNLSSLNDQVSSVGPDPGSRCFLFKFVSSFIIT